MKEQTLAEKTEGGFLAREESNPLHSLEKQYIHLSPEIYDNMANYRNCRGARAAQRLIEEKIGADGKVITDLPLENMLAIIEKYRKNGLKCIDSIGLNAYTVGAEEYRIYGDSTKEYQDFTKEFLDAPDFPYTRAEASMIEDYQGNISHFLNDIIIDRILLREALDGVTDALIRSRIWYAHTLNVNCSGFSNYVRKFQEADEVFNQLKTSVIPVYTWMCNEFKDRNSGTNIHGSLAFMRLRFSRDVLGI